MDPQCKRTGEAAVVAQELFGLQQVEQCFAAALVFFLDHAEDDFCFIGRFAQAGIVFRQGDVGFSPSPVPCWRAWLGRTGCFGHVRAGRPVCRDCPHTRFPLRCRNRTKPAA